MTLRQCRHEVTTPYSTCYTILECLVRLLRMLMLLIRMLLYYVIQKVRWVSKCEVHVPIGLGWENILSPWPERMNANGACSQTACHQASVITNMTTQLLAAAEVNVARWADVAGLSCFHFAAAFVSGLGHPLSRMFMLWKMICGFFCYLGNNKMPIIVHHYFTHSECHITSWM